MTKRHFSEMLSKPAEADGLFSHDRHILECLPFAWELYSEGDSSACSFLCRAAKKKLFREKIEDAFLSEKREILYDSLKAQSPKMRKNTARLIGALGKETDSQQLILALQSETVRMVIPSILLALGAVGGSRAKSALEAYHVAPARDASEEKHEAEEKAALLKALSAFSDGKKHKLLSLGALPCVQLICAKGMARYVAADCEKLGICVKSYADTTVTVSESNIDRIFEVRSFREMLIPVCKKGEQLSDLGAYVIALLDDTHEHGDEPYKYRIEYRGTGDRRKEIDRFVKLISQDRLVNSPSDYETELRIYADGSVKMKLFTYTDTRFDYRRAALPASIHPANAASVVSYAGEYLTENASVLDICCGSGTMLFERERFMPCRRLMGVDISEKAIAAAKENASRVFPDALFYHCDCKRFTLRDKADELITNLPFGNRVGTHENNERLYAAIVSKLGDWLRSGGIAIFYTMEEKLLLSELEKNRCCELIDVKKTEAGGLFPAVCIVRYTQECS